MRQGHSLVVALWALAMLWLAWYLDGGPLWISCVVIAVAVAYATGGPDAQLPRSGR